MRRTLPFLTFAILAAGLIWIGATLAITGASTSEAGGSRAPAAHATDAVATDAPAVRAAEDSVPAVSPAAVAELAPHTEKGLAYLANQQLPSGGWGQGGGWRTVATGGRIEADDQRYQEQADVANTAVASLALVRGGSTPASGPYAENVRRGIAFVLRSIEGSDPASLFVTDVRGTQLQSKIGVYVDTFLANLLLAEVRGTMPDDEGEMRLEAALDEVIGKIERHQRDDGTFADNRGWASVLSQSIANKALNRARQKGAAVADATLEKIAKQAKDGYDEATGEFRTGESYGSTAGVKLYEDAAGLAALDDLSKTGVEEEKEADRILASDAPPAAKREARARLEELHERKDEKEQALRATVARLADSRFVAGFGSSGGEEYLSYMNISEALAATGGADWERWRTQVSDSLAEAQNGDGSWSGHHCITGRTFVTASALLTLMADRAPRPLAEEVKG